MANTGFITYVLVPTSGQTDGNYTQAIHCNYIKKIALDDYSPLTQEINLYFPDITDFKFLANTVDTSTNLLGTGYTAHEIHAVVQIVTGSTYDDAVPDSTDWKLYNITSQVTGYTATTDFYLTPTKLTTVVFKIPLLSYYSFDSYNLDYLNVPSTTETDQLSFGDVSYFFGNVSTDIKAEVYTSDITITLPLNEFNSSSNLTWNGLETVYVSEIGIYDTDKNLVAIGKLNNPVAKDATIARTIVFAIDF